jgi:hypothetical protein
MKETAKAAGKQHELFWLPITPLQIERLDKTPIIKQSCVWG